MNRKITLFGSMLTLALGMSAQGWVEPTISPSDYAELKLSSATPGDTTLYYLYNIDGGAFLTNRVCSSHSQWSTHAAINQAGNTIMVTPYEIEGEEWDGVTVSIWNIYNNTWYQLFASSVSNAFVDYQTDGFPLWTIEKTEGNIYKIAVADSNTGLESEMQTLIGKSYMGFDMYDDDFVSNGVKPITPMIDLSEERDGACVSWAFIPESIYKEYLPKMQAYIAAIDLDEFIKQTNADYPEVSTADAEAVYNNTASTESELKDAKAKLQADIYTYRVASTLAGATNDAPKDATPLMTNSNFDSGNADGWTVNIGSANASGYQGDSYTNGDVTIDKFIQAWRPTYNVDSNHLGDGKMSTTITGLPAGKYKVGCDAIAVFQKDGAPMVTGVTFFVRNGNEVDMKLEIATENQKPCHYEITFAMSEPGDVELGIRTTSTTASWVAGDNFTIYYYGEVTEDPNKVILDGLADRYTAEFPEIDDVKANKDVKQAFTDEIAKARGIAEGYEEEIKALTAAYDALKASIDDYKLLRTALDECDEFMENLTETFPELADKLGDFKMDMEGEYDDETATSEYCKGASKMVYDKILSEIAENQKQGDEITAIVFNPNFSKGNDGWTWNPKNAADVKAASTGNPVVTAYHTTYDCFQTIEGLKPGIYKLTVQGYYRTASESTAYSEYVAGNSTEICAEVYVNNIAAKLMNAFDNYTTTTLGSGSYEFETGKWVPAGSTDIANVFRNEPDLYVNTVYGYVLDDGKLTLGVRETSAPRDACYSTFDNFHLYYAGVDPEAVAMVVDKLQEEADALDDAVMSAEARNNMDNAVKAVKEAGEDNIMAAIGNFFSAVEASKASVIVHEGLAQAYDALEQAVFDYSDAPSDKLAELKAVVEEVETAMQTGCETDAACEELISRAGKAITALKLPDGIASADNPIDYSCLLINPDLDQDSGNSNKNVPGWDRGSCNGYKQNTFSAFGGESHLYQTVSGLPAGKYIIEAQGAYRAGDPAGDASRYAANPEGDRNAWVFGTTSDTTVIGYLHRNSEYALEENLGGSGSQTVTLNGQTLYVPYNTNAYVAWFNAGYYITQIEIEVPEDGILKLGIDKPYTVTNDYININYVHLIYLGPVESDAISNVATDAAVKGVYNIAGQKLNNLQPGINIVDGKRVLVK